MTPLLHGAIGVLLLSCGAKGLRDRESKKGPEDEALFGYLSPFHPYVLYRTSNIVTTDRVIAVREFDNTLSAPWLTEDDGAQCLAVSDVAFHSHNLPLPS